MQIQGLFRRVLNPAMVIGAIAAAAILQSCGGRSADSTIETQVAAPGTQPQLAELQSLLDSELTRLGIDPARSGSQVPSSGNAVFDLQVQPGEVIPGESASFELSWTERLIGDYDQNGLVNASDLVPLAQNLGRSVDYRPLSETGGLRGWPSGDSRGADSANWRLARVDGNMDGLISAADITPIAQHWQESLGGYGVYRSSDGGAPELLADPQDDNAALSISRSGMLGGKAPDNTKPVSYGFTDTVQLPGSFSYYVAPISMDGGESGPASPVVVATLNQLPQAVLTADVLEGMAPLTVSFDASQSSDPDGSIATFEFDLDGDGTYEINGSESAAQAEYLGGAHTVRLRVTDNEGGAALAEIQLNVSDGIIPLITATATEDSLPGSIVFSADDSTISQALAACDWYIDDADQPAQNSSGLQDFIPQFSSAGTHTISLELTGTDSLVRSVSLQVYLFAAPVAVIDANLSGGMTSSELLKLSALNSTGEELSFAWDIDAAWTEEQDPLVFVADIEDQSGISVAPEAGGTLTVSLQVRDRFGKTALAQFQIEVIHIKPQFSFDNTVKPAGSSFSLDGSGSVSDIPIAAYGWDFDSDGTIDEQGPDPQTSFTPGPGRGQVTMQLMDGDGGKIASYAGWYIAFDEGIVIVRNDEHEYPANLDAVTDDLDSIPLNWRMIEYSDDLLELEQDSSSILYIWYRGGPGDGSEAAPYTRMWTAAEIDNYLGLMQTERNVLLMSQSHGKDPDVSISTNLWEVAQGMTLVDSTVPASEQRHPWAASLCTDAASGAELLGYYPTSPQNMSRAGSLELHYDSDGASAASRYVGAGSSGKLATKLEISECYQLCGIGMFGAGFGFPGGGFGSGFESGISTPLTVGQDLSQLSYGNRYAPDANIGFFPAYEHEFGSARLWVVGYPWALMSVTQSPGDATERYDVLHNIIGWLAADDLP